MEIRDPSVVPIMNYLYSLYDALVSISVPSDKAGRSSMPWSGT